MELWVHGQKGVTVHLHASPVGLLYCVPDSGLQGIAHCVPLEGQVGEGALEVLQGSIFCQLACQKTNSVAQPKGSQLIHHQGHCCLSCHLFTVIRQALEAVAHQDTNSILRREQ